MKLKFSGFYGDVMLTSVVEIAVLFGFFITYRLLAFFWGPDGVGVYSLIRRAIGLFQPFLFLGLGVGLSRYLAVAKDVAQRRGYLQAAIHSGNELSEE